MDVKKYSNIFKALSHPNRLELFMEIARSQEKDYEAGVCVVADIIKNYTIGAPTISHHLKELTNAGLIITERRGKYLVAKINKEVCDEIVSLFRR